MEPLKRGTDGRMPNCVSCSFLSGHDPRELASFKPRVTPFACQDSPRLCSPASFRLALVALATRAWYCSGRVSNRAAGPPLHRPSGPCTHWPRANRRSADEPCGGGGGQVVLRCRSGSVVLYKPPSTCGKRPARSAAATSIRKPSTAKAVSNATLATGGRSGGDEA
jgi:hypothetical protein